ncbi:DUF2867 domain-containing protein [Cellulomonas sp. DKR-3]|uniref:DUF2867 domain-containing protein n=1 Tax=Cellulomonas fulva TaxID=2835530 RepID=A0ABS5TY31_9CELL|nr:DUF2867 domain-containing protein [Cellulomonas fulva]MBT0994027.1 DUF2867 domain-containing protein [Cellulomonas fulva]
MSGTTATWSVALSEFTPDYAESTFTALPAGATTDPEAWARTVFGLASMPVWVRAALGLRQLLVPLLGIPRAPRDTFAVDAVVGNEALIRADDAHLDFRCGIAVDEAAGLVRVTTSVRLHNRRGRLYFAPVRLVHPTVVDSMLRRAARRLAPAH